MVRLLAHWNVLFFVWIALYSQTLSWERTSLKSKGMTEMTPRWRQRRWLLLPNRPLLAGDEVSPQDMSTCTLRTTTSSSRCFSMLCPVVHGSIIYLRVLCLCPGRPAPNPPAPYCGSACLSRPFLSGTVVSFIGKNTKMVYLVQVCRWSPNLRKFLPFLGRQ